MSSPPPSPPPLSSASPSAPGPASPPPGEPPLAVPARASRWTWTVWLIPLAAVLTLAALFLQSAAARGPRITIQFEEGAGISPNDPVTYRGVRVGEVETVRLAENLTSVLVTAQLTPDGAPLARDGAAFWIVRPEVSLTRVSGLETLIGPRYIAAMPPADLDSARPRHVFVGMDIAPREGTFEESRGLLLQLFAARGGSIRPGSPVTYREYQVGMVTDVSLAPDARFVQINVRIQPRYAALVRTNTRFANASGFNIDVGLMRGLSINAESLAAVVAGGIAFATPDPPGALVEDGTRFVLEPEFDRAWFEWQPDLDEPAVAPSEER